MFKKSLFIFALFLITVSISIASVPPLINYQGWLTDRDGNPLNAPAVAPVSIQFKIYDSENNGNILWSETQSVTVVEGIFSVLLGSVTPIPYSVFDGNDRYFTLQVESDSEMLPRKRLVSVGYSFRAYDTDKVDGKDASDFFGTDNDYGRSGVASDLYEGTSTLTSKYVNEDQANSVTASMIKDGEVGTNELDNNAVTSAKIASGQVVKSINSLKDTITLAAGTNITITPSANTLTFAASGGGGLTLPYDGTTSNTPAFSVTTSSTDGNAKAIHGIISSTSPGGYSAGLRGENKGTGPNGIGVYGSQEGNGWGVYGTAVSGRGVYGESTSGTGVVGNSNDGIGVSGRHLNTSGTEAGVYGVTNSTSGYAFGVHGVVNSTFAGGFSAGVRGENKGTGTTGIGVHGSHDGSGWGVYGTSVSGKAVYGFSTSGTGVDGYHSSTEGTNPGVYGGTNSTSTYATGVHGIVASTSPGSFSAGVRGENKGTAGLGVGVYGSHAGSGWGVYGFAPTAGYAGYFTGRVHVTNILSKGGGSFKIDHPLDPANKYLSHSFVESPDMKNVYDGVVILNNYGEAWIELPEWFQALNRDFRYQLTAIGEPAPNLYIAEEIINNRFKIAGGTANMKVSWQITGIRQDPFAEKYRIPIEEEKPVNERGYYLHPEVYGQSREKSIERALQPELD